MLAENIMYHLSESCESEIEVKKSRFICILLKIESESEVKEKIAGIKKQYPSATHYCYGFITGNILRSNDDGEPSGTAGMPILNVLRQKELDNVLAVVVRYFGGTLLGTAGLLKAYQQATLQTVAMAKLTVPKEVGIYTISVPYEFTSKIELLLQQKAQIINRAYDQQATYLYQSEHDLSEDIQIMTSGRYAATFLRTEIREIPA
ncbi:MAG: YigZ family protein [Erysipelotrichaceae bacterium]|nr:YigZ family protein [Erysipelotrichaceae bacterium]